MIEQQGSEMLFLDADGISAELKIRREIYLRIVTSFSATLQEKISVLEQALQSRDHECLRRTLHEIKGTSSNLRLRDISAAEQLMHEEVKGAADPAKMVQYLESIKKEAERLQAYVRQFGK